MRNRRLLAIESSTFPGSVALGENGNLTAEYRFTREERTAKFLTPTIQKLIREQGWKLRDIDAIAISIGPGSFTGLRIGLMTAKGIAYAAGIPLLAVDTFQVVAEQARQHRAMRIEVVLDAQQMGLYVRSFRVSNSALISEAMGSVVSVDTWMRECTKLAPEKTGQGETVVVLGDGLRRLPGQFELPEGWERGSAEESIPQSATVARLGWDLLQGGQTADLWSLQPAYLRSSGAEEAAQAAASGREQAFPDPAPPSPEPR
jgi:tRNA threonylcarbamoyladenosine biosynthesis protein TsaB